MRVQTISLITLIRKDINNGLTNEQILAKYPKVPKKNVLKTIADINKTN